MTPSMAPTQAANGLSTEIKTGTVVEFKIKDENQNFLEMKNYVGLSGTNYCEHLLYRDKVEESEDLEVDVLERADDLSGLGPTVDPDAPEHSSSFGNTFSGPDNGFEFNSSDAEVESQIHGENGASAVSDGFNMVIRKKKLTDHWRRFILPLMWRCKWIELRMKELRSQALKYDKELSAYYQEKLLQEKLVASDKSAARSVPMTHRSDRKQSMRRRKRKRIEETVDISSYMSNHNIFSYYDRGFKDDGLSFDDDYGDQGKQNIKGHDDLGVSYEWPMLDFWNGDNSLEKILFDIEAIKSRVLDLKTQLNQVICRNAGKISTSGLCDRGDPPYSSVPSPTCSPGKNTMPDEALNVLMPGIAVSSYGVSAHPDIIENTVELLSSAINASLDEHQIGGLSDGLVDDILIYDPVAKEELPNFEFRHPIENAQDTAEENEKCIAPTVSSSETEFKTERAAMPEHRVLKRCSQLDIHVRRSSRKRVERILSPGGWNGEKIKRRKSSGEQKKPKI